MIPITYLRSSMKGTFSLCKMRFFIEYVLGFTGPGNLAADKGTIVHKFMEILAVIKFAKQNNKRVVNDDIIGKISINKYDEDKIFDAVFGHYSQKFSIHNWTEKEYKECRKWANMAINFNGGEFDPRNQSIVAPEKKFDFELPQPWAHYKYDLKDGLLEGQLALKGTIDLITEADSDTLQIVDYKTGSRKDWATDEIKDYNYLQNDFQLRFYHLACSILYPKVQNILVTIFFIKDGGPFTIPFGKCDIPETLENIRKFYEEVRDTQVPALNRGWKCRFCNQSKTNFKDTNVVPIIQPRKGYFTAQGQPMSCCEQTDYVFRHRGMDVIRENMTKEGFSLSSYKAPGE